MTGPVETERQWNEGGSPKPTEQRRATTIEEDPIEPEVRVNASCLYKQTLSKHHQEAGEINDNDSALGVSEVP